MAEAKSNRFTKYFPLLLDALRSADPSPMRPPEAAAWVRARTDVADEDLSRQVVNGQQTIFENDIHWARFYLTKAGLMGSPKRGLWALTDEGRSTELTPDATWELYVRIRDAQRSRGAPSEEDIVAPGAAEAEAEEDRAYWFAGALWNQADDQWPRFQAEGIWQNGYDDQFSRLVAEMKPGDRIAVKASFTQSNNLPFDVGGKRVSVMRIKATGTILQNLGDGRTVKVAWDPHTEPRDWYFYTYRVTLVQADTDTEDGRRLVDFTFHGGTQVYGWWLSKPYWAEKYARASVTSSMPDEVANAGVADDEPAEVSQPTYTIEQIVEDGCFLSRDELCTILERWRSKKNLVLQGPPGTGKTWLAKRLGFALVGSNDRETVRSRLRVVQFHPSLAYEDFVRGWRPTGDGRLSLVDGILMQSIEAAASEPDRPFVLVIEEINRGNPAQIFGEMLTLLENTKRWASETIELSYRKEAGERVFVPKNLYLIGTMNVADRSLAMVDLALRRRFAFIDLEPTFGSKWRAWCTDSGFNEALITHIETAIQALNVEISAAPALGPQFRIGHSYVTPDLDELIPDGQAWFKAKVTTEIGPLLDEYWYDAPETARAARRRLLAELGG